jgi:hypothetical protein
MLINSNVYLFYLVLHHTESAITRQTKKYILHGSQSHENTYGHISTESSRLTELENSINPWLPKQVRHVIYC